MGMNREQMVEKAAEAISQTYEPGGPTTAEDKSAARAVLDSVLPQVTTVAELEALPWGSVLLSQYGVAYIWYADENRFRVGNYRFTPFDALADGSLTVVWQPEEKK